VKSETHLNVEARLTPRAAAPPHGWGGDSGGALFAQAGPLVHEVRKVVSRISRAPLEIVVSALGKEAPLWGSLLMASREARRQLRMRLREARTAV
jgi:hypothetical protein